MVEDAAQALAATHVCGLSFYCSAVVTVVEDVTAMVSSAMEMDAVTSSGSCYS